MIDKNDLLDRLSKIKEKTPWKIAINKYTEDVGVMGYCFSPKSGKYGVYFNNTHAREIITYDNETDALKTLLYLIERDLSDCPTRSFVD